MKNLTRKEIYLLNIDKQSIDKLKEKEIDGNLEALEEINDKLRKANDFINLKKSGDLVNQLKSAKKHLKSSELQGISNTKFDEINNRFNAEVKSTKSYWSNKIDKYIKESEAIRKEIEIQHSIQLQEYKQHLEIITPEKPKFSPEVINLQEQLEKLKDLQLYSEAEVVIKRLNVFEKSENESYQLERKRKIENLISNKSANQEEEYRNLMKRIELGLFELEAQRDNELETLNKKFKIEVKNLESSQKRKISDLKL